MSRKNSTTAALRQLKPATRWGRYMLAGALLLAALVASGISAQLFATSDTLHNSSMEDADRTLYAHGDRLRPLVEETDGAQTLNIYGPGGQIIAQVARDDQGNEGVRYLLTDHLGSTRVALDSDGNAVAHFEYGPYGETTIAGTAAAEVQYRYTGHPYDEAQGLYETPARGYDPATGRFLSVDPQRQDASPYVYADNNPVGYLDPTGGGEVPFFIQSGFKVDTNDRSPIADFIAQRLGLRSDQHVLNAKSLFNAGDGSSVVDVIHQQGAGWLREGHNQRMYWMVGEETSVDDVSNIRTGLDELRRWSPTLARDIVIIDNSEWRRKRNPSMPIQRELTRIGENPSVVRASARSNISEPEGVEFIHERQIFAPEELRRYIDTRVAFTHPNELRRNVDSVAVSVGELGGRVGLHEFPSLLRAARTNRPRETPGISFDPMLGRLTLTNRREAPGISFDPMLGRLTFVENPVAAIPDVP